MTINEQLVSELKDLRLKLREISTHDVFLTHDNPIMADVFITPHELNENHGTGVLLRRIFGESKNIFAIRSADHCGPADFGARDVLVSHRNGTRSESLSNAARGMHGISAARIMCVPYHADDVMTALAVKDLSGAPLCTWIMDDQNIFSSGVPDEKMLELLGKSSLRLAISPELRDAYESKFGLKIWLALPVVDADLITTTPSRPGKKELSEKRGVLIGNIWSLDWLDLLRQTIRGTDLKVDFYGPMTCQPWIEDLRGEMEKDGIIYHGYVPGEKLVETLQKHPYALALSGTLNETNDRLGIAKLSLPSRIPYILAASNTPLIVLGSDKTCAARFVQRLDIGVSCPYEAARFRAAVDYVCLPEPQNHFRQSAVKKAAVFNAEGFRDWIWDSLKAGKAVDDRFERFIRHSGDSSTAGAAPLPGNLIGDFCDIHRTLQELRGNGYTLDFSIDVGSSLGVWSDTVAMAYPEARFILVDPLDSLYEKIHSKRKNIDFEVIEAAVSDGCSKARFQVGHALYGSCLLKSDAARNLPAKEVRTVSLDWLAETKKIEGRGILKIDVQNGEHLVLEGARDFIRNVDVLVVELAAAHCDKNAKYYLDLARQIESLGFRYYKDAGGWRSPKNGSGLQQHVFYVRKISPGGPAAR